MRGKLERISEEFRKKIENFLEKNFEFSVQKDWILFRRQNDHFYFWPIFAFSGDENLLKKLNVFEVGIPFGTWEDEKFRFSLEISDFVGKEIQKSVVEINEKECEKLFKGMDLERKLMPGSYILKFKGRMIGGFFCDGEKILNYLPKVFQLEMKVKKRMKKEKKKPIRMEKLRDFISYFCDLPDFDVQKFLEIVHAPKERFTIRINTLKTSPEKIFKEFEGVKFFEIPWDKNKEHYFVNEKDRWITKSLNYLLGDFYLQEPASILAVLILDPKPNEKILDLCAAPGSKTTQIAQRMKLKGTIVANEPNIERAKILVANLRKCGVMNAIVTCYDGRNFPLKETFDKVLVDVPCTSIGSDLKSIYKWNKKALERLAILQKELIVSSFESLKRGGILVYSTCTISKEENEEVVKFLLKKYKGKASLLKIQVENINYSPGLLDGTIRVYPYQNFTESFFVAKIQKSY